MRIRGTIQTIFGTVGLTWGHFAALTPNFRLLITGVSTLCLIIGVSWFWAATLTKNKIQ